MNTYGDAESEGTGWLKIEGKFQQIYSGPEYVVALAANRDIYYRANVFDCGDGSWVSTVNHEGTHWVRVEQSKNSKIIFKQVEATANTMWERARTAARVCRCPPAAGYREPPARH